MSADQDKTFVEFVRSSSPALLKTAWFICGDPHQAEELVLGRRSPTPAGSCSTSTSTPAAGVDGRRWSPAHPSN